MLDRGVSSVQVSALPRVFLLPTANIDARVPRASQLVSLHVSACTCRTSTTSPTCPLLRACLQAYGPSLEGCCQAGLFICLYMHAQDVMAVVLFNVVPQVTDIVAATTYLALHLEASR